MKDDDGLKATIVLAWIGFFILCAVVPSKLWWQPTHPEQFGRPVNSAGFVSFEEQSAR